MNKLKVMTIVGTRPELIRLSRVIDALDRNVDHVLVHTGQNYDYELNGVFFDELSIRAPDHFLDVPTETLGSVLGGILERSEFVMKKERPDAVLILGDTNSSLAGIMAKRLRIPLYHMEAGNRSFDFNVPEEINRRIIDHIADFNLVYTEHARRHLLAEGLPHRRIFLTGSPMGEVLHHHKMSIERSQILKTLSLSPGGYFVVSMHREENVDHYERLTAILDTLNRISLEFSLPIIVSTHPRTRKRLKKIEDKQIEADIRFMNPFGFFDYVHLQMHARCTISDSGTVAEESSLLGFPAITMRSSMERPEALDTGSIALTGFDTDSILASIQYAINNRAIDIPEDYKVQDTSNRVIRLMLGTARLCNEWSGIRTFIQESHD